MSSDVAELERVVHDQPTNWTLTTLGGALEKSEGGGTPPRDVEEYWNGDIPWASVKDIVKGEGFVPEEKITPAGLANSTSKLIPAGTNIFAARMGVGAVVRYPFPVAINQDLMALTPASELDPSYLFYWLEARKKEFVAVATGTTVKGIRKDVLLSFPMLLPPLDEQRRIAEVLRSVDEAIAAADAVARQWEATFTTLLDAAFGDGEASSLGELCSLIYRYPGFYGFDQLEEGVPVIRGEHLRAGRISTDWTDFYFVAPEFSARFPKTVLQLDDVVMSVRGTVGTTAIVGASHVGSQISPNLIRLVADPAKIVPPLLYYAVQSAVARMRRTIVNAQALPAINAGDLKRVEIAMPPLPEQPAMLAKLNGAAEVAAQAVAAVAQARQAKTALMSDLLSGRVRVPA